MIISEALIQTCLEEDMFGEYCKNTHIMEFIMLKMNSIWKVMKELIGKSSIEKSKLK